MADKTENHTWKPYRDHQIEIRETIAAWGPPVFRNGICLRPTPEQIADLIRKVALAMGDVAGILFSQCARKTPGQVEFEYEVNRIANELWQRDAVNLFERTTAHLGLVQNVHRQEMVQEVAHQVVATIANRAILLRLKGMLGAQALPAIAPADVTADELGQQLNGSRRKKYDSDREAAREEIRQRVACLEIEQFENERRRRELSKELYSPEEHELISIRSSPLADMQRVPAPAPTTPAVPISIAKRKRGRPAKFTTEQKEEARKMKANGSSNRKIARFLYKADTPSASQCTSVPTILRSTEERRERAKRAAAAR